MEVAGVLLIAFVVDAGRHSERYSVNLSVLQGGRRSLARGTMSRAVVNRELIDKTAG